MSASATISGQTGPAVTFSSMAIPVGNLLRLDLDFARAVGFAYINSNQGPRIIDFDLTKTTTLTDTIASLVHTIVISGT